VGLRRLVAARGKRCGELATRLCADVGTYTRACKTVQGQSEKFDPDRCVRMLEAYPRVLSELKTEAASAYLPAEQIPKLTAGDPPSLGPADAKLQLVEFLDYENHDCATAAGLVREFRARYGDDLRLVVRQFPLDYHPHAQLAAEAVFAARAQGKFWEMHDALLADTAHVDRAALERRARELGLDMKVFNAALDKHAYAAAVDRDKALAQQLKVEGMPTLFLNGERMLNAVDRDLTIAALDEHLVRARSK
jgi:protein-disulfide isomerase